MSPKEEELRVHGFCDDTKMGGNWEIGVGGVVQGQKLS